MEKEEVFQNFHHFLESQLLDITYKSFLMLDKNPDKKLLAMFPPEWKPSNCSSTGASPDYC
jgi:hypothetical protein